MESESHGKSWDSFPTSFFLLAPAQSTLKSTQCHRFLLEATGCEVKRRPAPACSTHRSQRACSRPQPVVTSLPWNSPPFPTARALGRKQLTSRSSSHTWAAGAAADSPPRCEGERSRLHLWERNQLPPMAHERARLRHSKLACEGSFV